MSKTLEEVSEIVGVEVKDSVQSRRRSGFDFAQTEELIAAVEGMRENVDVLSCMAQESIERLKLVQAEQKKPKLSASLIDISFLNPILERISNGGDPKYSGMIRSAEEVAGKIKEEVWESIKTPMILSLASVVGLRVDGDKNIHLGPPQGNAALVPQIPGSQSAATND